MSLDSIKSSISSAQNDIQRLQRRLSDKAKDRASKSDRIASIERSITSSTRPSTIQSKHRQIEALKRHLVNIQRDEASLTKEIAYKTESLHKYQQDYYKEQSREQAKFVKSLERERRAQQSKQQAALDDLRSMIPRRDESSIPSYGQNDHIVFDASISHASEDKDDLVRPLAERLTELGFQIWYDESQLKVGDSLRRSIDAGLARSRFGIVVLSPSFFAKNWPQYELDGLVQREMVGGKVVLPVWHKVSKDEVMRYSPSLVDKIALSTAALTVDELASELATALSD